MIHFFTKIQQNVQDLEFTKELNKIENLDYRVFGCIIPFRYRTRLMFLIAWYPKLAYYCSLMAIRSLILDKPHPDVVVVESDIEVLIFSTLRALLPWKRPYIVYLSFIYTSRRSPILNWLRRWYFERVLLRCSRILCHSRKEISDYSRLFPKSARNFVFLPWGGNVGGWQKVPIEQTDVIADRSFRVLSAGRSGRDYPTLARAIAHENMDVTVICDNVEALGGIKDSSNLHILRDCYDAAYFNELRRCDVVVVPMAVEDISAGQMVVIQAMAYGKPVIVTRTPTIRDYVVEGKEVLMIRLGDADELRNALIRLRLDRGLYSSLRQNARIAYIQRHSQPVFTRNLVEAVADLEQLHGLAGKD